MRTSLGLVSLLFISFNVFAVEPPAMEEIRALVEENLAASEALDVDAALATIHPDSPAVPGIVELVAQLSAWELEMKPVTIELVGMAGEHALVHVVQQTRRVAGPAFMDNTTDAVWALRPHDGRWVFWSQMLLRLEPLEGE